MDTSSKDLPLNITATILESITLYWLTECYPTFIWPYRQLLTSGVVGPHIEPSLPRRQATRLPQELATILRPWVATTGNLVFYHQHESEDHFAIIGRLEVLLKDVGDFIAQVWLVAGFCGEGLPYIRDNTVSQS
ncbi:alpha/beta-hydrolase [Hypoxylon crocopeplum]|nr:alpha/beta-hydrolase [Hypoxylon crocopeplum]